MGEFCRNNLKFNADKEEQRQAHEFLEKIGRGQSQFIALLIKNFLSSCGVESPDNLSAEEVKKMVLSFQKLMEPEVDYLQRMIDSGQYEKTVNKPERSVTDHEVVAGILKPSAEAKKENRQSVTDHKEEHKVENEISRSVTDHLDDDTDDVWEDEDDGNETETAFDFADDLLAQLSVFGG